MDLISQVTVLGGVCDRATLVRLRSAAEVDAALRDGVLERDSRGRYALPTTRPALRTANRVAGVLSHRSAAQYWGWAQKAPPPLPEVTFPRTRRVDRGLRAILVPHWCELSPDDVEGVGHWSGAHSRRLHAQPSLGRGGGDRQQCDPGRRLHPGRGAADRRADQGSRASADLRGRRGGHGPVREPVRGGPLRAGAPDPGPQREAATRCCRNGYGADGASRPGGSRAGDRDRGRELRVARQTRPALAATVVATTPSPCSGGT